MNLLRALVRPADLTRLPARHGPWSAFGFEGMSYPITGMQTLPGQKTEEIQEGFAPIAQAYKSNAVLWAVELSRMLLFSEARFKWRSLATRELYGNEELRILERPWPNGTTGDLLTRMIQDADLAGSSYTVRRLEDPSRLRRLRPDWVTIVMGSHQDPDIDASDIDADLLGYVYHPGGRHSGHRPVPLSVAEVAHFRPAPDPEGSFAGVPWVVPVIRELMADAAATTHKLRFFEAGATPNTIISLDPAIADQEWRDWVDAFEEKYGGVANAYKTMFLGGGASAQVVGANLQQLDFKVTQGAGETRIAAAAGVPPVIVGLSEGLSTATYSNYGQARRRFADGTMRPTWRMAAGALQTILRVSRGAELWYDESGIAFLREDQSDEATINATKAQAIRQLVDAGFKPDTAVAAINTSDLSKLIHTDLYSVQLQPPTTGQPATPSDTPADNGGTPAAPPSGRGADAAELEDRAEWDTAYINDLPDSAFALILPGGERDESGRTVPRSLRKLPHHRRDGSLDMPHLRNALSREPQADLSEAQHERAAGHLSRHMAEVQGRDWVPVYWSHRDQGLMDSVVPLTFLSRWALRRQLLDELERHLPGKHDQSSHAGGKAALDYGALEGQAEAGGFSVTIHGAAPSTGCMVSPYPKAERKYAVSSFEADDVKAYRDNHRDLLSRPEHYLGGWRDGDTIYLDVSIHTADRASAAALAKQHGQLAYYDLDTGESIMVAEAA